MENVNDTENKAFHLAGKPTTVSTLLASYPPLFIGARGKEDTVEENIKWKTRRVCLLHGEGFRWKNRCRRCRHLIAFQVRLN